MALTLFLTEGFVLSVFPAQFQQFLTEADPRLLQVLGVAETLLAAGLITGLLLR
ncbi:MAG TPA: hypothetical protein VHV77_13065 [Pirellulales bacterium]|nr:hypothetical protein [Pirellulales bacterium]